MSLRTYSAALVFTFVSWIIAAAQNGGPVLTNEQVAAKAVGDAVMRSRVFNNVDQVRLEPVYTGLGRPIYNGLADGLAARGISILSKNSGASIAAAFDILGFDFHYSRGKSRGFLRAPMIQRVLDARVRVTLTDIAGGQLLGAEDMAVTYSDQLGPESADLIKSPDIPELAPEVPDSKWMRIIEPAVVTIAVGGLVYLFFANR